MPSNVFHLILPINISNSRVWACPGKFAALTDVTSARLKVQSANLPNMLSFYRRYYDNVREIDVSKSKWYVDDTAIKSIRDNLGAR